MSIAGTYECVTKSPMGDQKSTMTVVVDGDTFWLHGEKVRIADINAPETLGAACASLGWDVIYNPALWWAVATASPCFCSTMKFFSDACTGPNGESAVPQPTR